MGLIVYHQPQVGSGAKFNFHFFDRQKHSYSASFDGEGRCVQIADCQQHRHLVVGRNASGRLTITVSFPVVLTFEAEIDEITLSPREPEEALQQFIDSL